VFAALEKWCVRHAGRVTTVSRPFADELRRTYGRDDAIVIPSCIHGTDARASAIERASARAEMGFAKDDLVFVYSGGIDRHQAIPQLLALWQQFAATQTIRFLMLTKATDGADDALADFPLIAGRIDRRSVPRASVARYLGACDVGFILREPRLMNRVASPVKFAEYMAAGLAVVASPDIGDISSRIVEHHVGVVVDSDAATSIAVVKDLLTSLSQDRAGFRRRARELAATRYQWDVYVAVYRDLYEMSADAGATHPA
jgi:glycosyltransferase involved in cell wall biosynthesis